MVWGKFPYFESPQLASRCYNIRTNDLIVTKKNSLNVTHSENTQGPG
jgi:hypothetical protein